ncbi:MAG: glycoside hydrolase family 20 zincin-like fold domain-containing protein, partial [Terracidiphilus sp.]
MPRRKLFRALSFLLFPISYSLISVLSPAQTRPRLLPTPREEHFDQSADLSTRILITVPGHDAEDEFAARDLEEAVKRIAPDSPESPTTQPPYRVTLLRRDSAEAKTALTRANLAFDPAMESEGYVLILSPREATIVGATGSGVFYGVQTLKQLLPLPGTPRTFPTGTIRDWPAMMYRGIHDDLSRGPFPTLAFQEHQIRVFAA